MSTTQITIVGDTADVYLETTSLNYGPANSGSEGVAVQGSTSIQVGQSLSEFYRCSEVLLAFDTSVLQGAEILSAALVLTGAGDQSDTDFTIEARTYDWGIEAEAADWLPGPSLSSYPLVATLPTAGFTTDTPLTFTDVSMVGNLNVFGFTRVILNSDRMRLQTVPGGLEQLYFYSAEYAIPTNRPRLLVTITTPVNDQIANATNLGNALAGEVRTSTAAASSELLEFAPGSGFADIIVSDVRTQFPCHMDEMGFAMDGNLLWIAGGFNYGPGVISSLPGGISLLVAGPGGDLLGTVFSIDTTTGLIDKLCDFPVIDSATWSSDVTPALIGLCTEGIGAAIIDGVMYITGGDNNYYGPAFDGTDPSRAKYGTLLSSDSNHANSEIYKSWYSRITLAIDLDTGTVTRRADKPCASEYVAAVAHGGKMYAIGGYTNSNPYPYIDIYDPNTDSWTTSSIGPYTMAVVTAIVHSDKIYILAGDNQAFTTPPNVGLDPTAWEAAALNARDGVVLIYDIAMDSWTVGASLLFPSDFGNFPISDPGVAVERNGQLLMLGAIPEFPGGNTLVISAYDPAMNTWTTIDLELDRQRSYFGGGLNLSNQIYLFGGLESAESITASVGPYHGPTHPATHSLWWTWTASFTGESIWYAQGSSTVGLEVYTGTTIASLVPVAHDTYTTAVVTFNAVAGQTYTIQVNSDVGASVTLGWSSLGVWPATLGLFDALPIGTPR